MAEQKAKGKTQTQAVKASFFPRLGAFLIDVIILGLIGSLAQDNYSSSYSYSNGVWPLLVAWVYLVVMDVKYGATLGKKALKLQVISAKTGKFLTWQEALLREVVGRFVNSITLGIGYLWVLWDKDNQGLHDKIADTYVVKQQ